MEYGSHEVLISIVTSTYNCLDDLTLTAESIKNQHFRNIQWIVIDGGSLDGTVEVIESYQSIIDFWVSEKDRGIYNAWNKAVCHLKGEWVIFLGAGDCFFNNDVLSFFVNYLFEKKPRNKLLYGDVLQYVDGKVVYHHTEVEPDSFQGYRPVLPYHQGIFHHKSLFLSAEDNFDESYRVVADSKFLLSALKKTSFQYIGFKVAKMDLGGVSQSPTNSLLVMREFLRLEKEMGYILPKRKKFMYVVKSYIKYWFARAVGDDFYFLLISLVDSWLRK